MLHMKRDKIDHFSAVVRHDEKTYTPINVYTTRIMCIEKNRTWSTRRVQKNP